MIIPTDNTTPESQLLETVARLASTRRECSPSASQEDPALVVKAPSPLIAIPGGKIMSPFRLQKVNLNDSYHKTLAPPPEVIEKLLYHGLTLIGGPPKVGKSFLALQAALSVATGEPFLGALEVKRQGKVLMISLEDGEARLRKRVRDLHGSDTQLEKIEVVYDLTESLANQEVLAAVRREIEEVGYELVIIDTLVAAMPEETKANDAFRADYRRMQHLRKLTEGQGVAVLVNAHTRKPKKGDDLSSLTAVAGTGGITAAVDAGLIIQKTKDGASVHLVSRDIEERDFELERDATTSGWVLKEAAQRKLNDGMRRVMDLILRKGSLGSAEIQAELADAKPGTVRSWLSRMTEGGSLTFDDGKYGIGIAKAA
jgi:AAA domain